VPCRYHYKTFPVVEDGRLEGLIGTGALARYPRDEWDRHHVGEAMRRDLRAVSIGPATDALHALEKMQRSGSGRLLVTDQDRLVGILSLKDLLRFLHLKLELEGVEDEGRRPGTPWPAGDRRETAMRP
jgi:CBS domain-containing protein